MTTPGLSLDALARAVNAMPEDALSAARQAALQQFSARGFPTTRDEDWKYTDLAKPIDISRRWLEADTPFETPDANLVQDVQASIDAAWIVIANGRLDEGLSSGLGESGVEVTTLANDGGQLDTNDLLADLNTALLIDGIQLRITADKSADRPIGLLIVDSAVATPVTSQARIEIELAQNSSARIVEYHISSGDNDHYGNTLINLRALENSRIEYVRFQERALNHSLTARLNVRLERDSRMRHCGIDIGGQLTRNDLKIDIAGTGASAKFDGLYIADADQHVDNHTRIDHRVGPAESSQEYRGILNGRCRAVWNGKAIVHKGADGTDARQANHNLLLSEHAEINAKPELEIYADEVKCAHGTTVGQLDEAALFYLRSRGLDRARAERVLTRAFAAEVVAHSPIPELHELIGDSVERRLRRLAEGSRR